MISSKCNRTEEIITKIRVDDRNSVNDLKQKQQVDKNLEIFNRCYKTKYEKAHLIPKPSSKNPIPNGTSECKENEIQQRKIVIDLATPKKPYLDNVDKDITELKRFHNISLKVI